MSTSLGESLFKLVKSLKKQEKRYFKVFSGLHTIGEAKNYILLFDALERMEVYDEKALKEEFKNESFVNRFDNVKTRLFQAILKSLDVYHSSGSIETEIRKKLHHVEILFDKGMYEECDKIIRRLKKTALQNNRDIQLLDIMNWEQRLKLQSAPFKDDQDVSDFYNQPLEVIERVKNLTAYQKIAQRFYMLYRKLGSARNEKEIKEYKSFMEHPLLSDEGNATSSSSKYLFYHVQGIYNDVIGDYEESYQYKSKSVDLVEENPELTASSPYTYIGCLYNLITSALGLQHFDIALTSIQKLKDYVAQLPASKREEFEAIVFYLAVTQELSAYANMGEFNKALKVVAEAEEKLASLEDKLINERKIVLYYRIAYAYFEGGELKKARDYINKLFNETNYEEKQDYQSFARILNLLVHFDLGNDDLLTYIVKSTYRFLYKREKIFQFEKTILKFIRKTPSLTSRKDLIKAFKDLREDLLPIVDDPFEKSAFEFIDMISWLESKIEDRPLADIVKEKLNG